MIILKSFFRSKSSKIFLLIFTSLLITIFVLTSFGFYYSNFVTNVYKKNSYFIIKSEKEISKDLYQIKNLNNIQKVLLFDPEFDENLNKYTRYFIDYGNDTIIAMSNNYNLKLNRNEIIIEIPNGGYESLKNINLISNNISFRVDEQTIDFNIKTLSESVFSRIIINAELFDELFNKNILYSYTFSLNNYDDYDKINEQLKKIDGAIDVKFIQSYQNDKSINTVNELKNVISILKYVTITISIIFFILFLVIIGNIIDEEFDKMYIERLIGFSKIQIKFFIQYFIIKSISINNMYFKIIEYVKNILGVMQ